MNVAKAAMVNAVKAAAKDVTASAAKAVMAAVVATAVASARVSVQASATSVQKAHQPKPVSHVRLARRAKAVATNAKANVMVNEVVIAQNALRVNAVTPCLHKVKLKARNRWPWTLPTTRWANAHHAANVQKVVAKVAVNAVKAVVSEAKAAVNVASVANLTLSAQKATSPRSLKAPCKK